MSGAPHINKFIAALEEELESAHRVTSGADPTPEGEDNRERAGAELALLAMAEFCRGIGIEYRLYAPLMVIAGALADADQGLRNDLFTPQRRNKGRKLRLQDLLERATAAGVMSFLMEDLRMSREDAAGNAAYVIGADAKKLADFRDNIGRRVAPKEAISKHDDVLKFLRNGTGDPYIRARSALASSVYMSNHWNRKHKRQNTPLS